MHEPAIDLSSLRVPTAMSVLDGVRQGQALGALLGYRFERGLRARRDREQVTATAVDAHKGRARGQAAAGD